MEQQTEEQWVKSISLKWYQRFIINTLKCGPIPQHIAFIMDGNRRYAKEQKEETIVGHMKGFQKLGDALYWCRSIGIKEITFYAFSIENFKRDKKEVDALMKIASEKMERLLDKVNKLNEHGVCFRFVGNMDMVSESLRARASKVMLLTKDNKQTILNVAMAYTSQDEIAHAMQTIKIGMQNKEIADDDVDEYLMSKCMYIDSDVDIMIRTSGEVRFSDFILWQSKNTNVLFRKVLWPAFSFWEFICCVFYYQVHNGNQIKMEKALKYTVQEQENPRVERFLENTEKRKWLELETYTAKV